MSVNPVSMITIDQWRVTIGLFTQVSGKVPKCSSSSQIWEPRTTDYCENSSHVTKLKGPWKLHMTLLILLLFLIVHISVIHYPCELTRSTSFWVTRPTSLQVTGSTSLQSPVVHNTDHNPQQNVCTLQLSAVYNNTQQNSQHDLTALEQCISSGCLSSLLIIGGIESIP